MELELKKICLQGVDYWTFGDDFYGKKQWTFKNKTEGSTFWRPDVSCDPCSGNLTISEVEGERRRRRSVEQTWYRNSPFLGYLFFVAFTNHDFSWN